MSRSVQHLLDCAAADNLSPDEDFGKAITALKSEGTEGSVSLAAFIRRQADSRTKAITWSLRAAGQGIAVTPELLEAVSTVG